MGAQNIGPAGIPPPLDVGRGKKKQARGGGGT